MNLHSLKLPEKTSLLLPSRASILRRWMLHHLLHQAVSAASPPGKLRGSDYCSGSTGTACTPVGGTPDCMLFISPDSILKKDTWPKDQGLKKDFGDTTDQDYSTPQQQRPPARSERCLPTAGTPISAPGMGTRLQYFDMEKIHHGRKLPPEESASEKPIFSWSILFPLSLYLAIRLLSPY